MLVKDVMQTISTMCRENETVASAMDIMENCSLSALPVLDFNGYCCGMVTTQDIYNQVTQKKLDANRVLLSQVVHHDFVSCSPEDSITQVVAAMRRMGVPSVPVVEGGVCVGLVNTIQGLSSEFESRLHTLHPATALQAS